jgi:uncharacterized repeat protein (TIGR03803 family)
VLHNFNLGADGGGLWGSLLLDSQGNLYGTAVDGGPGNGGTVFELSPQADGRWKHTTIAAFKYNQGPATSHSDLIFDPEGNLYGTTATGSLPFQFGAVFELKPSTRGWQASLVHGFGNSELAVGPYGGVVMDQFGNLYGIGGDVAFELSPEDGHWKETILHVFCSGSDACGIPDHPILDAEGNLYGTSESGGTNTKCGSGCGTVFELQHLPDGSWKEIILHSFASFTGDGVGPGVGALIIDKAGNLYGTTDVGGTLGGGTAFKLTRGAHGQWAETILHNFALDGTGDHVSAGVVMDGAGNLYGTTIAGGDANCACGVVYKLSQCGDGTWMYTVLHAFTGIDGAGPDANLIIDETGNLYGTTPVGGAYGAGVVFEVTP